MYSAKASGGRWILKDKPIPITGRSFLLRSGAKKSNLNFVKSTTAMKAYRIEIKWALIYTLAMLVWMAIERLAGLHGPYIARHALFTNLAFVPAFLIYCLALRDKRDHYYGGTMTYREGLVSGLIMTGIVALLSPLAQVITHTIITPGYFANVSDYAVASGQLTRAEAEQYFNLGSYVVQSAVGSLLVGIFFTAVAAIFFRKHPSEVIGEPLSGGR